MQDNPFAQLFAVLKVGVLTLLAKLTVIPESVADEAAIEYLKRHPEAAELAFNQQNSRLVLDPFDAGSQPGFDPAVYRSRPIDPYDEGLNAYHMVPGTGPFPDAP